MANLIALLAEAARSECAPSMRAVNDNQTTLVEVNEEESMLGSLSVNEWLNFYLQYFPTKTEARDFIEACEQQVPPNNTAKILMHQAQRLISLSDDILEIRPHTDSLRLLFLLMCAENIAKLHDGFTGEGHSRNYVRKFFKDFLSDNDKQGLGAGFRDNSASAHLLPTLGLDRAVDMLYEIRCDVVHEGEFWSFAFHDGTMSMVNTDPDVIADITFDSLRDIVVRGSINATRSKLTASK
ncbi:MAG: hypothetical protein E8D46_02090 [Nitrospira sp.]|nr:MAG: hypothetical protein E8D46_02090 [Nitrospira sp.]